MLRSSLFFAILSPGLILIRSKLGKMFYARLRP